jgi:hypothetical protein
MKYEIAEKQFREVKLVIETSEELESLLLLAERVASGAVVYHPVDIQTAKDLARILKFASEEQD